MWILSNPVGSSQGNASPANIAEGSGDDIVAVGLARVGVAVGLRTPVSAAACLRYDGRRMGTGEYVERAVRAVRGGGIAGMPQGRNGFAFPHLRVLGIAVRLGRRLARTAEPSPLTRCAGGRTDGDTVNLKETISVMRDAWPVAGGFEITATGGESEGWSFVLF